MADTLRVLYVDDEPGLLNIGKLFLEKGGAFAVDTFISVEAALERLKTERYDAIISDYQMPDMDGIAFLKQLKESGNTTPFIIFTGKGREEVVIEALNCGADFYLQKGGEPKAQFAELSNKIRYAVTRRQVEEQLSESQKRTADIIEFLPDATFAINTNGDVIAWNRAMEDMTGVHATEILGKGNYEYSIPVYHERRPILVDLVLNDDPSIVVKYPTLKRDGRTLIAEATSPYLYNGKGATIWFTAAPLYDHRGEVVGAIESIRDITDLKRAEMELRHTIDELTRQEQALRDSEQKYREIFENSVMGLFKTAPGGQIINANDALARMYGYPCAAKILKFNVNAGQLYANLEDREDVLRILAEKGVVENYETLNLKRDGTRFWVSITARTIRDTDGAVLFYEGTNTDITERKRAENALRESESFNRSLVENLPDYIAVYGLEGQVLYVNPASVRAIGYRAEELAGTSVLSYVAPECHDAVIAKMAARREGGDSSGYEIVIVPKDGRRRTVIAKGTPIQYHDSPAVLLLLTDITERKEAEAARQRQSITLSILNNIISAANKAEDLPGLLNSILEESLRLLDFDAGGIYLVDYATRIANVVHSKNLPPELLAEIKTVPIDQKPYDTLFIQNEPIFTENYAQMAPGRSKKFGFQSMASIPLLTKGVAIGALNIVSKRRYVISEEETQTLISIGRELGSTLERMIAEEDAKNASKNFETLFNSIDEMVFVLNMQGCILAVNNTVQKRLLYTSEELTGTDVLLLHVPERRNEALHIVQGMIAGTIDSCPVPVLTKEGTRIEVETKVTHGWWNNQNVLIGVSRDITKRRIAEEALKASLEKFRGIFDTINDGIHIHEIEPDGKPGKFIELNEVACRMLQYTREELLERGPLDIATDYHSRPLNEIIGELSLNGHSIFETEHRRKNGTTLPVEVNSHVVSLQGKRVIVGVARDISERKRDEVALKGANKKLSILTGITRHDINNQLTVLMGFLSIIEQQQADHKLDEYFQKVTTAAKRISAMIRFTKEYEEIGVHAPRWQDCRTLVDTATKEAHLGKVLVQNDLSAGMELFADPMVVKVFYNLMDNAVRYGGKITTIRFSVTESSDGPIIVCEDDGVGVPADEKEKIFERGFGKNTGMGLFLSREILDITGITIKETGEPGKGARFEIIVPKGTWRMTGKGD
ncbi:MAG: PAS domain S-box protein [Methanomicrobiales archaeon]|nr:PAS domain S-box protein [Methanomicrobiales archaeon]